MASQWGAFKGAAGQLGLGEAVGMMSSINMMDQLGCQSAACPGYCGHQCLIMQLPQAMPSGGGHESHHGTSVTSLLGAVASDLGLGTPSNRRCHGFLCWAQLCFLLMPGPLTPA